MTSDTRTAPNEPGSRGLHRVRRLVQVYPPSASPRQWPLGKASAVLGREPGRDGIVLDDTEASRRHAELRYFSATDDFRVRDLGSKNGTFLEGKRIDSEYLTPGSVIRLGTSLLVYEQLDTAAPPSKETLENPRVSLLLSAAQALADRVAPEHLPVLITGPIGAGKELIARRIHERSGRQGGFIAINCATLTGDLVGAELFGYSRGAFTGADQDRDGLFLAAHGGTLFLDEVADLSLSQQPALLRALQENRIRPLGSTQERAVDVRVVSATHLSPDELRHSDEFRGDLFSRIAGLSIELAGLERRRVDILPLLQHFAAETPLPVTKAAAEALLLHDWPYNVRELQSVAAALRLSASEVGEIDVSRLPPGIARRNADHPEIKGRPDPKVLESLLAAHQGNVSQVARILGVGKTQVHRWMKRLGLDPSRFRNHRA